jgi:hypothetical protein
MKQLIYIGPDLIFNFLQRIDKPGNVYHAIVKAAGVKLSVNIQFEQVQGQYKDKVGPVQCSMGLSVGCVAGDAVSLEKMNQAVHCLTVNSKQAAEVCCQAFLNGFLDSEF